MDLEQHSLKKFLAVAEELNFNRAALRLHVSQPALSQAIRRLEAALGRDLFSRDSHSVALTEFGKAFYTIARTLVAQHDRAVIAALEAARGEPQSFRVGYSPLIDLTMPCAVQIEFATAEPGARVELRSSASVDQVLRLAAGQLDAGLVASPFAEVPGLTAEILKRDPFMIGLACGHPLARQPVVSLGNIRDEPLIWLPRSFNPALFDWFVAMCVKSGYMPRIAQDVTTVQEFLEFVAQGLGITFLPRSATTVMHPGVVFRQIEDERLWVEIVVAYRQGDQSATLARLVNFLKERFQRQS